MSLDTFSRPLAVVTGASSGIGLELARCCAAQGFELLIAADEPQIEAAAQALRRYGTEVQALQADLATPEGVARLCEALRERPVAALLANAGRGLGQGFLDQDFDAVRRLIDTNLSGTLELVHQVAQGMARRGRGRILITGSIAGLMPGSFQAAYNGSKAFLDSFAAALRNELAPCGVSVTCLMPGPTETRFFERAGLLDTQVGQAKKDDAAEVARAGFEAMMAGKGQVVSGWKNKLQAALAHVTPAGLLAAQHRRMAAPGTAPHAAFDGPAASSTSTGEAGTLGRQVAAGAIGGVAAGAVVSALLLANRAAGIDRASDMVTIQRRGARRLGWAHRPVAASSTWREEAAGQAWHMALSAGLGAAYGASLSRSPRPAPAKGALFGLLFYPIAFGLAGPLLGLTNRPTQERPLTLVRRGVVHAVFGIVTAVVAQQAGKRLQERKQRARTGRMPRPAYRGQGGMEPMPSSYQTRRTPVDVTPALH